jgi:hypothetical protein
MSIIVRDSSGRVEQVSSDLKGKVKVGSTLSGAEARRLTSPSNRSSSRNSSSSSSNNRSNSTPQINEDQVYVTSTGGIYNPRTRKLTSPDGMSVTVTSEAHAREIIKNASMYQTSTGGTFNPRTGKLTSPDGMSVTVTSEKNAREIAERSQPYVNVVTKTKETKSKSSNKKTNSIGNDPNNPFAQTYAETRHQQFNLAKKRTVMQVLNKTQELQKERERMESDRKMSSFLAQTPEQRTAQIQREIETQQKQQKAIEFEYTLLKTRAKNLETSKKNVNMYSEESVKKYNQNIKELNKDMQEFAKKSQKHNEDNKKINQLISKHNERVELFSKPLIEPSKKEINFDLRDKNIIKQFVTSFKEGFLFEPTAEDRVRGRTSTGTTAVGFTVGAVTGIASLSGIPQNILGSAGGKFLTKFPKAYDLFEKASILSWKTKALIGAGIGGTIGGFKEKDVKGALLGGLFGATALSSNMGAILTYGTSRVPVGLQNVQEYGVREGIGRTALGTARDVISIKSFSSGLNKELTNAYKSVSIKEDVVISEKQKTSFGTVFKGQYTAEAKAPLGTKKIKVTGEIKGLTSDKNIITKYNDKILNLQKGQTYGEFFGKGTLSEKKLFGGERILSEKGIFSQNMNLKPLDVATGTDITLYNRIRNLPQNYDLDFQSKINTISSKKINVGIGKTYDVELPQNIKTGKQLVPKTFTDSLPINYKGHIINFPSRSLSFSSSDFSSTQIIPTMKSINIKPTSLAQYGYTIPYSTNTDIFINKNILNDDFLKKQVIEHELLHRTFPKYSEQEILSLQKINRNKIPLNIKKATSSYLKTGELKLSEKVGSKEYEILRGKSVSINKNTLGKKFLSKSDFILKDLRVETKHVNTEKRFLDSQSEFKTQTSPKLKTKVKTYSKVNYRPDLNIGSEFAPPPKVSIPISSLIGLKNIPSTKQNRKYSQNFINTRANELNFLNKIGQMPKLRFRNLNKQNTGIDNSFRRMPIQKINPLQKTNPIQDQDNLLDQLNLQRLSLQEIPPIVPKTLPPIIPPIVPKTPKFNLFFPKFSSARNKKKSYSKKYSKWLKTNPWASVSNVFKNKNKKKGKNPLGLKL